MLALLAKAYHAPCAADRIGPTLDLAKLHGIGVIETCAALRDWKEGATNDDHR